jgi:PKD repeat protein
VIYQDNHLFPLDVYHKTINMKILFTLLLLIASISFAQVTKNVCFIGNSYTYSNNMPGIISSLATADGNTLITDQNTPGGQSLMSHSNNATSLNKIAANGWDYVVLQDQSQLPSFPWSQVTSDVFPYAEILSDSIRAANECATPLFFNTWGRRDGDSQWDSINTFDKMNQRLFVAYGKMADDNSGKRSPVGNGFDHVQNDIASPITHTELYSGDGSHPSIYGTYLAACIFYEIIFESTVEGNAYVPSGITGIEATYLQDVANHVVNDVDSIKVDFTQPEASFSFTQSGTVVTFTNESSHDFQWMWDFGNGNTSTEESPSFDFGQSGDFPVTLTAINCSLNDDTTQTLTFNTTSIEQGSEIVTIYPNPSANGNVSLSAEGTFYFEIFNLEGRLVKQDWANKKADLNLETGLYIIRVNGITQKLIVL